MLMRVPCIFRLAFPFLAATAFLAPVQAALQVDYTNNEDNTATYDTSAANNPLSLNVSGTDTATQSGQLSGTGAVIKIGTGTLTLAPDVVVPPATNPENTYTGGTTLQQGTLRLQDGSSIGSGALTITGGTFGNATPGADLFFENNVVVGGDFSIDAQGTNPVPGPVAGSIEIFGDVDLGAATTRTITLTSTGLACFGGTITGNNLTFLTTAASSQAMVCSSTSNALTGTVRVGNHITLELDKDPGFIAISGNLLIDSGATVILDLSDQFAATSDVEVNGTLVGFSGGSNAIDALTGTGVITSDVSDTLEVNSGIFDGTLTADLGLTKASAGTLLLTGTNTYTGATNIEAGSLVVNGSLAPGSAVTIHSAGTLAGTGTVGALTIASGGTISPGNSPGKLATGTETWQAGGSYLWEINDLTGAQGTAYDWLDIDGNLVLTDTSTISLFTIKVTSLTLGNVAGLAANFDPALTKSWIIAAANTDISGFDPTHFAIDTSGFANQPGSTQFTLTTDHQNLVLTYTAVPEPAHLSLFVGIGLVLAIVQRARRGRAGRKI